jgi:hypothetical protein
MLMRTIHFLTIVPKDHCYPKLIHLRTPIKDKHQITPLGRLELLLSLKPKLCLHHLQQTTLTIIFIPKHRKSIKNRNKDIFLIPEINKLSNQDKSLRAYGKI